MGKKVWTVRFSGWPWQRTTSFWASELDRTVGEKWGWNPFVVKGMGRFGGGWGFKIGIVASKTMQDFVIDLVIGSIRVTKKEVK